MPAKKKAAGAKSSWTPAAVSEDKLWTRPSQDAYMVVHVRGVMWQFLDFTQRLPATDNIASVMKLITERHGGSITGLTLYKDEVHPRNLLDEPRRTLDAVGFALSNAHTGTDPEVVVYYDTAPHSTDCPLLLCAPANRRIEARHANEKEQPNPLRASQSLGDAGSRV
eukprot:CAMPEP_0119089830 /NCGR_PEP_ID=MMETSP1178-20130426/150429_1 /TAXON_ID=33656 /ORGANISM="unid sp, Strain CCMP2000" /LENGTH=166 /DNA_ID=CAMNT_0007073211 /DNA_START=47 /DNA_END=544 /DNA_ORIENTATION=+